MTTLSNDDTTKLITIAIHTYEKAQVLQTLLRSAGVEAVLQNVNQIQPVVSAGVRVRIRETDLPRALSIIEDLQWNMEDLGRELEPTHRPKSDSEKPFVLLPIDFSEASESVCKVGFHFAERRDLRVVILHVALSQPFINMPISFGDSPFFAPVYDKNIKEESYQKVYTQLENFAQKIKEQQKEGIIPDVPFTTVLRDGAPDDVILSYARRHKPVAIIMGTKGKTRTNDDLIGSVAAEVIDSAKVPVLVVPQSVSVSDLANLHNVAVATSFDQRDMVLFDKMLLLMSPLKPNYRIFNISKSQQEYSDLHLRAMTEYHKAHYPDLNIEMTRLEDEEFSEALGKFIEEYHINLIIVNTYKRNLLSKFITPSMARRILFHAGTPILVMHSHSSR